MTNVTTLQRPPTKKPVVAPPVFIPPAAKPAQPQAQQKRESGNLFDLVQRVYDNKWVVWVRKDWVALGLTTLEEWEERGRAPWLNPTEWVMLSVTDHQPTVSEILQKMGVKQREAVAVPPPPQQRTQRAQPVITQAHEKNAGNGVTENGAPRIH